MAGDFGPPLQLFLDGLNLAYWRGNPPSLRLPLTLMPALMARGHAPRLFFDASAPHRLGEEAVLYAELLRHPRWFVEARAGIPADRLLLRQARDHGASILSRDHYQDHRRRHRRLIDAPGRVLGGWADAQSIRVPALDLELPLPDSAQAAWTALRPLLDSASG